MGKVYLALKGQEKGVLTVKGPLPLLTELLKALREGEPVEADPESQKESQARPGRSGEASHEK